MACAGFSEQLSAQPQRGPGRDCQVAASKCSPWNANWRQPMDGM